MIYLNNIEIKEERFPDNTLRLKIPQLEGLDCINPIITWNYNNDGELFTLITLVNNLKEHYSNIDIDLNLPYIPHARMDRVKNSNEGFTLKSFCQIINSLGFSSVIVTDPHSNVAAALIDRIYIKQPTPYINKAIELINDNSLILFYPDEGSMKRYSETLNMPYAFGVKRRNWNTGRIESLDIIKGDTIIQDNAVLIVDDICSYGGTFFKSAQALKDEGAKAIYLYITHCESNIYKGDIFNSQNHLIDAVFTASIPDGIFIPNPTIEAATGIKIHHSL